MCASRVICCAGRNVTVTFCKLTAPADVVRRAEVRASARRPLDPNCASSSYQTRGLKKQKTIRRIVFCERSCPKQEACGVRHDAGITEPDVLPYNGRRDVEDAVPYKERLAQLVTSFKPTAPATAVRRAQASAGSSFAIRSCIYILREVANGERKTKIQIKRRNPFAFPRAGFNLKCNLLCDEFAQSRKHNRIFNNLFLFSVLCRIRTSSHTIFSCFTL